MITRFSIRMSFFVFLLLIPLVPSKTSDTPKFYINDVKTKLASTNFNISKASINFTIQPEGEYRCRFTLEVLGSEQTPTENLTGSFRVEGKDLSDFYLGSLNGIINSTITPNINSSSWGFSIDQKIQPGEVYIMWGYFQGNYTNIISGVYTYQLGIDWGTLVGGYQKTIISLDTRYHVLTQSDPQTVKNPVVYITELHWINSFITGFSTTFKTILKSAPNIFLHVYPNSWTNARIGETRVFELKNNGSYPIHGWIWPLDWISSNVTEFTILANKVLSISFTISSTAPLGSNDTIEIITDEFNDKLIIPVFVSSVGYSRSSHELSPLLFFFALLTAVGVITIVYTQQTTIISFIQKRKKLKKRELSLSTNPSLASSPRGYEPNNIHTWQEIHSRWNTILTDKELTILELLFQHGSMNQQSIAEEMEISKMTISRIVTRLEMKELIFRERKGMSKIVRLNQKKL
ncbi:MAG: helix-turn-helix transcriptional regulator [Candidatus Hodarchaeales archaeon]